MTTGQLTQQARKVVVRSRIIPARLVLDIDPETGQEFSYEWKSETGNPGGRWLNLTTENYHSDEFVARLELDVLQVHFGGSVSMDGQKWRDVGSPRFLRTPLAAEVQQEKKGEIS